MKCPNCKYVSFEYLNTCKKCGSDLIKHKEKYHINYPAFQVIDLLSYVEEESTETSENSTAQNAPSLTNIDIAEEVVDLIDNAEEVLSDADININNDEEIDFVSIDDNISLEDDEDISIEDASDTITDNTTIDLSAIETDENEESSGDIDLESPISIDDSDSEIKIEEDSTPIEINEDSDNIELEDEKSKTEPEYELIVDESDNSNDSEIATLPGFGDEETEKKGPKVDSTDDSGDIELDDPLDFDFELDTEKDNLGSLLTEEESIELDNIDIEPKIKADKDQGEDDLLDIGDIELDD